MKSLRKLWIFWTSTLLLGIWPHLLNSDCLPAYRYAPQTYSFVRPGIVDPTIPSAPFFLDFERIYEVYGDQDREQVRTNLQEWHQRFCEVPEINDMGRLIYRASIRSLEQLKSAIRSKDRPVPISLQGNSFAIYLHRNGCRETVDYLIFAKRCEPYAVLDDPWADRQKYLPAMRDLIEVGLREFRRTESHYFRLRYAYQIIRLAHYSQQYQRVLDLHEYLMPKTDNDPSIIDYWIMGHRAGALQALGQEVEAAYLFSRIFENEPGKRESAYRSFRIGSNAGWEALLARCRNEEEQATLYALRANSPKSRVVEEMKAIYALDPDNHHLEVLLLEAVKRMEKNLLGASFNRYRRENRRYHNVPDRNAGRDVIRLREFVHRVNVEGGLARPQLWQMAEGYLALLAGDYYAAEGIFADLRPRLNQPMMREQLDALELVMDIVRIDELSDQTERRLAAIQFDNNLYRKFPDFPDLVFDKIAWLYEAFDRPAKSYLHRYRVEDLIVHPQMEIIDSMLVLSRDPDLNRLERALLRDASTQNLRNDLLDLKGMLQLAQDKQIPAVETLKQMDNVAKDDYVRINPFEERLNDCINCARRDSFRRYNREQVILRMQELEYKALADPEQGPRNFYLIGLGRYNMTYFGYAWEGMDKFRSGISLKRPAMNENPNLRPHPEYPDGNLEAFDCAPAQRYFELAAELARERDPELAAKATFMAAKCEQNRYFAYGGERTYQFFTQLRDEYAQTEFYQRAIAECAYFADFTSR